MTKRTLSILVSTGILLFAFLGCSKDQKKQAEKKQLERKTVQAQEKRSDDTPKEIIGKDGAPMVLIPSGKFRMGGRAWPSSHSEKPVHTVYLDAFYIDKYEVTNAKYAKFLGEYGKCEDAAGHPYIFPDYSQIAFEVVLGRSSSPGYSYPTGTIYKPKAGYGDHPVVGVSWHGAAAYAQFYGKRLPTEAEWEKAARGGLVGKLYPWGNAAPDGTQCNFADRNLDKTAYPCSVQSVDDGYERTAPVGSFEPNGYGLYDMAGNVVEWCADWYDSRYYARSPKENPKGPSSGKYRVVRGGGWNIAPVHGNLSTASRAFISGTKKSWVGFRCVADVTP